MKRHYLSLLPLLIGTFAHASVNGDEAVMTPAQDLEWNQEARPPFAQAWVEESGAHGRFFRFPPKFSSPHHFHTHGYHGIVIEGVMDNPMHDADDAVDLPKGSAYFIPGKAVHRTRCISETPCQFYVHQEAAFDLIVVESPEK